MKTVEERFWEKVSKGEGPDACWTWATPNLRDGYGRFRVAGKMWLAHRWSYQLAGNELIDGLTLDHLCRVRHCVNPDHLEQVTQRVNTLRGAGPSAIHATKTHCPQGHELAGDNLVPSQLKRGRRTCLTCARETALARRAREREERIADGTYVPHGRDKTHCIKGHAFDEANTHVLLGGERVCRECKRNRKRNTRQRAKATAPA